MVPASRAQQDAAQAAVAAKPPSTNGHSAPIEGLSIKQRASGDSAEESGRDKPAKGIFCPPARTPVTLYHSVPDMVALCAVRYCLFALQYWVMHGDVSST